jgi:diguanylate cyclase (GGDEF)-like protein/PAS domain S-box-containing protein
VNIEFSFWLLPPLIASVLAIGAARYVRERWGDPGSAALFWVCIAAALWAALRAASLMVAPYEAKLIIEKLIYVPITFTPLLWLGLAIGYSGRSDMLKRWPMGLIYAVPLVTLVVVWTNGATGLFWQSTGIRELAGTSVLMGTPGLWFRVHTGYFAAVILGATVVLALHIAQSPRHWWRLGWVFGAPALLFSIDLVYFLGGLDQVIPAPDAIGLPIATTALAFGLMRRGDTDYAPVARSTVVEEMQDCVIVIDRQGRCVDVNKAATDLLNVRPERLMPVDLEVVVKKMRQSEEPWTRYPDPLNLRTLDGEMRSFDLTVTRLGPRGGRDRSVLVLRDVTETVRIKKALQVSEQRLLDANERLRRLANTDELTELPNRRSFFKALERELERSERYDQPVSVVLLDLDHFKQVNDTWGHPVGDRVLISAARAVEGICRDSDVPGRIGGEEIAVLLLQTDTVEAELVAQRIRRRIAQVDHMVPGDHINVTASFGVATSGPGRVDVDALMAAADEALYEAKHSGRNCVVVAPKAGEQTAIDFGN